MTSKSEPTIEIEPENKFSWPPSDFQNLAPLSFFKWHKSY